MRENFILGTIPIINSIARQQTKVNPTPGKIWARRRKKDKISTGRLF
jgi:hypothetical protein